MRKGLKYGPAKKECHPPHVEDLSDGGSKIFPRLVSGSAKRKERNMPQ